MSAKTATNFVYASEVYTRSRLNDIETEVKILIAKSKGQFNSYEEAYKTIVRSVLFIY